MRQRLCYYNGQRVATGLAHTKPPNARKQAYRGPRIKNKGSRTENQTYAHAQSPARLLM